MNARNWLIMILKDNGISPDLVADEPATIYSPVAGYTALEFNLRIRLTDEQFEEYLKKGTSE